MDSSMMIIPVTAMGLAAVFIILQTILMFMAGLHRGKTGIAVGIGGDLELERKVRRHGNLAENAPIFLITLALAEMLGASSTVIMGFAVLFLVARIAHVLGFASQAGSHLREGGNKMFVAFRAMGGMGTLLSGVGLGAYGLYMMATM